jgi:hypothetical protein
MCLAVDRKLYRWIFSEYESTISCSSKELEISTDRKSMNRSMILKQSLLRHLLIIMVGFGLAGCVPSLVTQQAVADYQTVASNVSIGDAKEHVLSILKTNQDVIPAQFKKRPERYLSYGVPVEIHFMRTDLESGLSSDDDDFTPYVFKNDVLVSVGWRYVSKAEFLDKAREAMSAAGAKADEDIVGDRR